MSGQQRLATMTVEEFEAHFRKVVREEFSRAGLRVDAIADQDEARRDFMFIRSLRNAINGAASKIGLAIVLSIASGIIWLLVTGVNAWRGGGP